MTNMSTIDETIKQKLKILREIDQSVNYDLSEYKKKRENIAENSVIKLGPSDHPQVMSCAQKNPLNKIKTLVPTSSGPKKAKTWVQNSKECDKDSKDFSKEFGASQSSIRKDEGKQYTIKPEISHSSRFITTFLQPSTERIRKPKKIFSDDFINSLLTTKPLYQISKSASQKEIISNGFNRLYESGLAMMKRHVEETKLHLRLASDQEASAFAFKPNLTATQTYYEKVAKRNCDGEGLDLNLKKNKSMNDLFHSVSNWTTQKERKILKAKKEIDSKESDKCNFAPKINKTVMKDNEYLILTQICQINNYVNKRRNFISKRNEKKNAQESKNCYCHKFSVSPRKFVQVSESKCREKVKKEIAYIRTSSPRKVLYDRSQYGVEIFFECSLNSDNLIQQEK